MSPKIRTFNRKELYEEVWKEPMVEVAKHYDISDVGLKKVCKKLQIPTPYNGYWARVRAGQEIEKPNLPEYTGSEQITTTYYNNTPKKTNTNKGKTAHEEVDKLYFLDDNTRSTIYDTCKDIVVPSAIKNPSNILRDAINFYEKLHKNKASTTRFYNNENPHMTGISVTTSSYVRAIIIMDTIIKTLNSLGYSVSPYKSGYYKYEMLCVEIFDEKVPFRLTERRKKVSHVKTQKELNDKYGYYSDYDLLPTGNLILIIEDYCAQKREWQSRPSVPLENRLGDFIVELVYTANASKIIRKKRELEWERRRAEERREAELEALKDKEKRKIKHLKALVFDWEKACSIRSFLKILENDTHKKIISSSEKENIYKWISWAKQKADWLDPFIGAEDPLLGKKHIFKFEEDNDET